MHKQFEPFLWSSAAFSFSCVRATSSRLHTLPLRGRVLSVERIEDKIKLMGKT